MPLLHANYLQEFRLFPSFNPWPRLAKRDQPQAIVAVQKHGLRLTLGSAVAGLALTAGLSAPASAATTLPSQSTPTSGTTTGQIALAFSEASQQSGAWAVPAPYTLVTNWDGSSGSRPVAIAYAPVSVGVGSTLTGPTLSNAT